LSFQSLTRWLQKLREDADRNVVVMLVGNKYDLQEPRAMSTREGVGLAKNENLVFIETSVLDATNVQESFTRLITEIVHQRSKPELDKGQRRKSPRNGQSESQSPRHPGRASNRRDAADF
jgi:Ras-related protein Rab-11A